MTEVTHTKRKKFSCSLEDDGPGFPWPNNKENNNIEKRKKTLPATSAGSKKALSTRA